MTAASAMPSETTAEQVELRRKGRQRLVGAITLALLAVVFIPMLLDPEPRSERAGPLLAIPPRDAAPPLASLPPAPAAPATASLPAPEPVAGPPTAAMPPPAVPAATPEAREKAPSSPPAKPAIPPTRGRAPASSPPKEATPAREPPRLEGFAVQVGAFRDEAKLRQAREKLAAAGIAHYTDRQPDFTRLRAGPFPTREAADRALADIRRAGLPGAVVPLP